MSARLQSEAIRLGQLATRSGDPRVKDKAVADA